MKQVTTLLALAIAMSASSIVCANPTTSPADASVTTKPQQHDKVPMRERFQQMDSNHDGLLTQTEIGDSAPGLAKRFDQIDSNHDGKLSMDEIHQAKMQRKAMKAQRNQSKQGQDQNPDPTSPDAMDPDSSDGQ